MKIEDMKIELGEYLEAAGFADAYNQILSKKTDEEIKEMYKNTFEEQWCLTMEFFEFLGDTFSFLCGVVILIIIASTLKLIVRFILDLFF